MVAELWGCSYRKRPGGNTVLGPGPWWGRWCLFTSSILNDQFQFSYVFKKKQKTYDCYCVNKCSSPGLVLLTADEEAKLDELLVEVTEKRRTFPRQILPHVVHGLKAERRLMVCARLAGNQVPGLCSSVSVLKPLLPFFFQGAVPAERGACGTSHWP